MAVSYLLDEDVNPLVAVVAAGFGLDVVTVHDLGRTGYSDEQQFEYAVLNGRIVVTRNRDDYLHIARHYHSISRSFPGVLLVPYSLPDQRPEAIAHALNAWDSRFAGHPPSPGTVDFLRPPAR